MDTNGKYLCEVFSSDEEDTIFEQAFSTYGAAVNCAKKQGRKHAECYVFVYVPKDGGIMLREDWTGGRHEWCLDCEVY